MQLPESMRISNKDAREAFLSGYKHQMDGDLHEAIRYYRISLDYQPTAEAYTFLGWAYSQQDRLDEAIDQCMKAIEADPDFGNPYNDIGAYLLQKGKGKMAVEWFKKALDAPRYESYCFPHFNLGRVYRMRGHFREARDHFRKALEEQPEFEDAEDALQQVMSRWN